MERSYTRGLAFQRALRELQRTLDATAEPGDVNAHRAELRAAIERLRRAAEEEGLDRRGAPRS